MLPSLPLAGVEARGAASGHVSRAVNGSDNCHGHEVRVAGSTLIEEGRCSGPLGGSVRADMHIGATFSGAFTFFTSRGQIRGRGSATPTGSGRYESFAGTLVVTGGTGRYADVHGRAKLYGVFDRQTYSITAQTRGTLSY